MELKVHIPFWIVHSGIRIKFGSIIPEISNSERIKAGTHKIWKA